MYTVVSGIAGMGIMRAIRAGDYTLIAAQQRIPISASAPLTRCFCAQARSRDALLLVLEFDSIVAFVVWSIPHCLENWNPEFTFAACVLGMVISFGVASFLFVVSYLGGYLISFSSRGVSRIE